MRLICQQIKVEYDAESARIAELVVTEEAYLGIDCKPDLKTSVAVAGSIMLSICQVAVAVAGRDFVSLQDIIPRLPFKLRKLEEACPRLRQIRVNLYSKVSVVDEAAQTASGQLSLSRFFHDIPQTLSASKISIQPRLYLQSTLCSINERSLDEDVTTDYQGFPRSMVAGIVEHSFCNNITLLAVPAISQPSWHGFDLSTAEAKCVDVATLLRDALVEAMTDVSNSTGEDTQTGFSNLEEDYDRVQDQDDDYYGGESEEDEYDTEEGSDT